MNDETVMQEVQSKPGYYAILPAGVRYDKRLAPMERILYAEITALAQKDGSCWAKNSYFCELFEASESTVRRWVSNLQKCGYILTEPVTENGKIIGRRIFLNPQPSETAQNRADRLKMSGETAQKQAVYYRKNNTSNNNTPLPPKGAGLRPEAMASPVGGGSEAEEAALRDRRGEKERVGNASEGASQSDRLFEIFWKHYPRKADKKKARRAWAKLRHVDKLFPVLMKALMAQKRSEQWQREGGRFVPLPSTWLNGERWADDVTQAPSAAPEDAYGYQEVHRAL